MICTALYNFKENHEEVFHFATGIFRIPQLLRLTAIEKHKKRQNRVSRAGIPDSVFKLLISNNTGTLQ